ncbi:unnamed protein product [Rotaria sp. Silwood2]|nr:unnamed protein product [Rotaria sp. Silwood2]CAF3421076.1 unnamed protein product [Rotaria sp. Silwood2]CAF3457407.1 unnamed protein product [Rotaria sp. Silwood2]CAF4529833.1 unnamed protein product [Rotaria sp. Silwood2]CAF4608157.1 unnamed protein product [Rotaria sp. Silwood2]
MTDQSFNNEIDINRCTGFVYSESRWNCGSWMNKMGSSQKALNKDYSATPRHGSAIELVGLCRATLVWLIQMNKYGHYPYHSIEISSGNSFCGK